MKLIRKICYHLSVHRDNLSDLWTCMDCGKKITQEEKRDSWKKYDENKGKV